MMEKFVTDMIIYLINENMKADCGINALWYKEV